MNTTPIDLVRITLTADEDCLQLTQEDLAMERNNLEERLRALLDPLFVVSLAGNILTVAFAGPISSEERARHAANVQRVWEGDACRRFYLRIQHKKGHPVSQRTLRILEESEKAYQREIAQENAGLSRQGDAHA